MSLRRDKAEQPRSQVGAAIATWLAKHEDVFDVVLDDRVWLVGLTEKTATVAFGLENRVCDLVPDDWSKSVKADSAAMLGDGGMQRHDRVAALVTPPRPA